jgi:hypothetical protein
VSGETSERRSHPRQPLATNGSNPLIATLGVLPRAALICDLSAGGLGLLTTFAPPQGAILPVWLPGPPGEPSRLILATVIHVQPPTGDGLYRVGIACHEDTGRAALQDLIGRLEREQGEENPCS